MKRRRSKKKRGMGYGLGGPFGLQFMEDIDPDRPHFYIYNGLMTSKLFNMYETVLIIYLIGQADDSGIDSINTLPISIDRLSKKMGMGKDAVRKHIRSLEEKGVLVRKGIISGDEDDLDDTYGVLNYISVWDCKTLDELKKETDRIKSEIQWDG